MLIQFVVKIWSMRLRESFKGVVIGSTALTKAKSISSTVVIVLYSLIIRKSRYSVSKSVWYQFIIVTLC